MRLNKFIASASSLSRRKADEAIANGQVTVNGKAAEQGQNVDQADVVALNGRVLSPAVLSMTTIMLNKPVGFVVSRSGQGSRTIYELLPPEHQHLNPIGRLDKNSSGLLLLTSDGQLAHDLTHPSRQKIKIYEVSLDKSLQPLHQQMISDYGVTLDDGPSKLMLEKLEISHQKPAKSPLVPNSYFLVSMTEGRNRQIRRTFAALGYEVKTLHRTHFGPWNLGALAVGDWQEIKAP